MTQSLPLSNRFKCITKCIPVKGKKETEPSEYLGYICYNCNIVNGKEAIKDFVQKTLGCGCPEEVFRQIESQADVPLDDHVRAGRINIGNRLLIYIAEIKEEETLMSLLPFLIEKGKTERDSLQFNRFRLVLATDENSTIDQKAKALFETIEKDEKIHLHTIKRNRYPSVIMPHKNLCFWKQNI